MNLLKRRWTDEEDRELVDFVNNADNKSEAFRIFAEESGRTQAAISNRYYTITAQEQPIKVELPDVEPELEPLFDSLGNLEYTMLDNLRLLFRYIQKLEKKNEVLQQKLDSAESDLAEIGRLMQLARKFAKEEAVTPTVRYRVRENGIVETATALEGKEHAMQSR